MQTVPEVDPKNFPVGHWVHTVKPVVAAIDPAAHGVHEETPPVEYEPAEHTVQADTPASEYLPATHELQVVPPVATPDSVPCGHEVHTVAPEAEIFPEEQAVQDA